MRSNIIQRKFAIIHQITTCESNSNFEIAEFESKQINKFIENLFQAKAPVKANKITQKATDYTRNLRKGSN